MSEGSQLDANDFPQAAAIDGTAAIHEQLTADENDEHVSGIEIPIAPQASVRFQPAYGALLMVGGDGEVRPLEEMETEAIRFAISHYRGQMSEVARRLKIGRSTLYRKLDEADTEGSEPRS
jgi:DNA-binding NtrC family response regulator